MRFSTIATAAALAAVSAAPALAGGFAPAIEEAEPVLVEEQAEKTRSDYGILLALLVAGGVVATASSNDDTTD